MIVGEKVGGRHLVTAAPDVRLLAQQRKAGHRHRHRLRNRENMGSIGQDQAYKSVSWIRIRIRIRTDQHHLVTWIRIHLK
jgi:hypothetical protein